MNHALEEIKAKLVIHTFSKIYSSYCFYIKQIYCYMIRVIASLNN